jgi:hypothetical protein
MSTDARAGLQDSGTTDESTDNHLSVPQLARESITHFDGDELQDWAIIEAAVDASTVTLRRLAEGAA